MKSCGRNCFAFPIYPMPYLFNRRTRCRSVCHGRSQWWSFRLKCSRLHLSEIRQEQGHGPSFTSQPSTISESSTEVRTVHNFIPPSRTMARRCLLVHTSLILQHASALNPPLTSTSPRHLATEENEDVQYQAFKRTLLHSTAPPRLCCSTSCNCTTHGYDTLGEGSQNGRLVSINFGTRLLFRPCDTSKVFKQESRFGSNVSL